MNRWLAPSPPWCRILWSAPLVIGTACAQPRATTAPSPADEAARAAIAAERTVDVARIPERTVGVPPLSIAATDTMIAPLAYGLADLLATDLARSSRLTVVDRMRLDAVLRELKLANGGNVDPATAPRVGRIIGARRLVVGAVSQLPGGEISLTAKLADVATGGVTTAVSARAPLARILDAEAELALRIIDALGITLTAAERSAIQAHPTRNVAALLAYSRGVRDETFGRYGAAAQHFQAALAADPSFANARAHLTGVEGRIGDAGGSSTSRRASGSAGRAALVAAAGVNPSLADATSGGAAGAVATGATNVPGPVQRAVLATVVIYIQQVP